MHSIYKLMLLGVLVIIVPTPSISQSSVTIPDQTLVYAFPYQIGEYSVWAADSYATAQWNQAVYAGLYSRQSALQRHFGPDLAVAMSSVTPDGMTFIVDLKPDLTFDNGNPITAEDVEFSYQVALTPAINLNSYSALVQWFTSNSSIIAVDADTVSFTLNETYAFALGLLTGAIIDKSVYIDQYNDCVAGNIQACDWNSQDGSDTVGTTGPYSVDNSDTTNNIITVTKNYNYWNQENVWADTIVFKFIQTKEAALSELTTGTIDIIDSQYVPLPEDFVELTGVDFESVASPTHHEMSINHIHPYFGTGEMIPDKGTVINDHEQAKLMRKALSHIMNREFIVGTILDGLGTQATTVMPAASLGHDHSLPPHEYDILLARKIMEDIGFNYSIINDFNRSDPNAVCGTTDDTQNCFFDITVLSPNRGGPARLYWEHLYVTELPKIGIGVKEHVSTGWDIIISRTFGWDNNELNSNNSMVPLYLEGGYDVFFVGYSWALDWNPSGLYTNSGLCDQGDCGNFYNYINATVENKIFEYLNYYDLEKRMLAVKELQAMLYHEIPVIPIVHSMETWGWKADVLGLDLLLISGSTQEWGNVRKEAWVDPATLTSETKTDSLSTPSIEPNDLNYPGFIVVLMLLIVSGTCRRIQGSR